MGTPIEVTKGTVITILIGLALFTFGGYDYAQQSAAVDDAVSVDATIVESSITQTDGRGIEYDVHVTYTYYYQGTEYTSDQLFPGDISPLYETRSKAQSVIKPYDSGTTVTAYVDPDDPSEAFLERQTTQGPLIFIAFGGLWILLATLDAIGVQNPGQEIELRPESEYGSTRYQTLFGIDRDTVNHLSKRLAIAALIILPVSLVTAVLLVFASSESADSPSPSMDVELSDPIGVLFVTVFIAILLLIAAALLYGIWSFTEYRRLRERMPEPRPPSPFKHPTRLVTILLANDDLDTYGTRVKRTGFAFGVVIFLIGVLLEILVF